MELSRKEKYMYVLKTIGEEMTKDKALQLVNIYINNSIMSSDVVTPTQTEYERCLMFLRDYVRSH